MFCTSLRQTPCLAPIVPSLQASTSLPLRESRLTTHDISIPLPPTNYSSTTSRTRDPAQSTTAHQLVLLATPAFLSDSTVPSFLPRLQRFSTLATSPPGLILLLPGPSPHLKSANQASNVLTMIEAQAALSLLLFENDLSLPVLPVSSTSDLLPVLQRYISNLLPRVAPARLLPAPYQQAVQVLRRLDVEGGEIAEHDVNVLTDVAGSLGEVITFVREGALDGWVDDEVLVGMNRLLWGRGGSVEGSWRCLV